MNEDRCVCCGAVVPEGRQVCPQCQGEFDKLESTMTFVASQIRAQFQNGGNIKC